MPKAWPVLASALNAQLGSGFLTDLLTFTVDACPPITTERFDCWCNKNHFALSSKECSASPNMTDINPSSEIMENHRAIHAASTK